MVDQKTCTCGSPRDSLRRAKGCGHEHNCQSIYRKLAGLQGTSVVLKVSLAFLLPILVFIISLAAFERTLEKMIIVKIPYGSAIWLQTILGFLFALSVTFVVMLVIKMINTCGEPVESEEFRKNR